MDFISDPKDLSHLDMIGCREGAQMAVPSQENAARMLFYEGKGKAVQNR